MQIFCRSRDRTEREAGLQRGYHEPRASRGLSDRVFFDTSRRRKARVLFSAGTVALGVVAWLLLFATMIGLDGGLEAALPEPISVLKGQSAASEARASSSAGATSGHKVAAIELHAQQETQKYRCIQDRQEGARASAQRRTVFAVIPADLPWAAKSLRQSCDTIDVALPTWFHLSVVKGSTQVLGVSLETRDPLFDYAKNRPELRIMPVIRLDPSTLRLLKTPKGPGAVSKVLVDFVSRPQKHEQITGFCLDAGSLVSERISVFAMVARQVTAALRERSLSSCVKLPSGASEAFLVIANRFFDKVIVDGYQKYWIGSAPQPLAGKGWFEKHITSLQKHVDSEKLVVELGTHAVDWVSGIPRPKILPFAQIMSALAKGRGQAEFAPAAGNTQVQFVDEKGLQHRVWMLDAASAQNQVLTVHKHDIGAIGLSGLGLEDPGIWAVLDQTNRGLKVVSRRWWKFEGGVISG